MEPITSTRNPRVREVAALARRRERRQSGSHLVEGPNAVLSALAAGVVEEVWLTEAFASRVSLPSDAPVREVSDHVLERVADARTPQGVVAIARTPAPELSQVVGAGVLVVLDEVADPGNLGTIVRTADAAGAAAVVVTTGSADVFGPKTIRAAAGSTYHLPIVTEVEMAQVARIAGEREQPLIGLDGAASQPLSVLERTPPPLALVLGNEAHGLSEATAALLDDRVAIPLRGRAESLNVSAAAAIALYAAMRED